MRRCNIIFVTFSDYIKLRIAIPVEVSALLTSQGRFGLPKTYSIATLLSRLLVSTRGFRGCLPRFDSRVSHTICAVTQLRQGWRSVTSHLTRRALQFVHASLARFRGRVSPESSMLA